MAATGQGGAKKKYWSTTDKSGIEVPKILHDTLEIDRKTGTDFWGENIGKDMMNVIIASKKLNGVMPEKIQTGNIKPGYKHFSTHMVFILKFTGSSQVRLSWLPMV